MCVCVYMEKLHDRERKLGGGQGVGGGGGRIPAK